MDLLVSFAIVDVAHVSATPPWYVALYLLVSTACVAALVVVFIRAEWKGEVVGMLRILNASGIVLGILVVSGMVAFLYVYW